MGEVFSVPGIGGTIFTPTEHGAIPHLPSLLRKINLHRIPTPLYQVWCDIAEGSLDKNQTRREILKQAKEYALEKFPGQVIVNTVDFTADEAKAIHPHLTWGMYIQLAEGKYDDWSAISAGVPALEDSLKLLSNG